MPDHLFGVEAIAAGSFHIVFLMRNATLKVCGFNQKGQLGMGDPNARASPTVVLELSGVKTVAAGYETSICLMEEKRQSHSMKGPAWRSSLRVARLRRSSP